MRRSFLLVLLAAPVAVAAALSTGAGARPAAPAHFCVSAAEIQFRTPDGVRLVGHRWGGPTARGKTTVVLAHQSRGDLCEWQPYARRLARLGFFVFAFDFRSHGDSGIREGDVSARLPTDVAAAVTKVRALGARKVYLVGASMGAIAVVAAGATIRPAVTGVASVSAPAVFNRLDATKAAPRLRIPTLYLAAEQDQNAGYDFAADARTLHGLTAAARKQLEIYPGSAHGVALATPAGPARTLLERFLRGR